MPTAITKSGAEPGHAQPEPLDFRISAFPAHLFHAAYGLLAVCRSRAALAMMSERDLTDVGLLPWEVRSEFCR